MKLKYKKQKLKIEKSETIRSNISFFHTMKDRKKLLRVVKTYNRKSSNQVKTLNTKVIEKMGDTLRSTVVEYNSFQIRY
jgi:hypothetical protein